jgi:Mg2+-importing ATPase
MAARGVIVRRLEAIENLGSMDVLCTDKTGTLTEGKIALDASVAPDGAPSPRVAELALLNASLQTGIDNPLDAAIVASAPQGPPTSGGYRKVDEIPYDFQRRRLTVVVAGEEGSEHRIITKGAYTYVLDCCTSVLRGDAAVPLDAATRASLDRFYQEKGSQGFRVLGVAVKTCKPRQRYGHQDEQDMTFAGFLLFFDPIKPEIMVTLADLDRLGIGIKIVTGDNRFVAMHVAEAIGLRDALLTGEELQSLSDEALWHRADRTDVFAEVDPQQKERIVRAMQRAGHAVGYLGDGINDAPALHEADVGISVDQAVDVARESADIILLRRDLDVLKAGVEDGRRTFANTLKYISITTSANFGNMLSMALATLFLPFLPLLPKQILLNNFLSDFPSIAISTDNVDKAQIEQSQRWSIAEVRAFMLVFGIASTLFDLVTFALLLRIFKADEVTFQTGWFVVSVLTELVVVLVLRTRQPFYRSRPSALLFWATIAVAVLAVALPFAGPLAGIFSFTPLSLAIVVASLVIVAAYVATTEGLKIWFYRRLSRHR